jgi:hypothetical protein
MEIKPLVNLVDKNKIYDYNSLYNNSKFIIDKELLVIYNDPNKWQYLRSIYDNYIQKKKIFKLEYHKEYFVFNNIYITHDGLIKYNNNYYYDGQKWEILKIGNYIDYKNITKLVENVVISIAKLYSDTYYHFTIECFISLAVIPDHLLKNAKIHIGNGKYYHKEFILEMFKLINIDKKQIVYGDIYSSKIYIPLKNNAGLLHNLYCYEWYKKIINKHIKTSNKHKYVILVKRSRRGLDNFEEIKDNLHKFSNDKNLELIIHDDSNLPSLIEQFNIFNQAKYVFTPHGATGILIPAMREKSWYIEFIKKEWYDPETIRGGGEFMARIAYACGINYYMSISKNDKISICKLNSIIEEIDNTN